MDSQGYQRLDLDLTVRPTRKHKSYEFAAASLAAVLSPNAPSAPPNRAAGEAPQTPRRPTLVVRLRFRESRVFPKALFHEVSKLLDPISGLPALASTHDGLGLSAGRTRKDSKRGWFSRNAQKSDTLSYQDLLKKIKDRLQFDKLRLAPELQEYLSSPCSGEDSENNPSGGLFAQAPSEGGRGAIREVLVELSKGADKKVKALRRQEELVSDVVTDSGGDTSELELREAHLDWLSRSSSQDLIIRNIERYWATEMEPVPPPSFWADPTYFCL